MSDDTTTGNLTVDELVALAREADPKKADKLAKQFGKSQAIRDAAQPELTGLAAMIEATSTSPSGRKFLTAAQLYKLTDEEIDTLRRDHRELYVASVDLLGTPEPRVNGDVGAMA